jgi:hypothetical protein
MRHTALIVSALLLAAASPALAQKPDNVLADSIGKQLRKLQAQEEIYYSNNNTYTKEVGQLSNLPQDMHFTVRSKDLVHGYVAEGSHAALKGGSCVVFIGKSGISKAETKRGKRATVPGVITCDPAYRTR